MFQMHSACHIGEGLCSVKALFTYQLYPKILMGLEIAGNKLHISNAEERGIAESRQKAGKDEDFTGLPLAPLGWPGYVAGPSGSLVHERDPTALTYSWTTCSS